MKISALALVAPLLFSGCVNVGGLTTLKAVSDNTGEQEQILKEETDQFEKVFDAVRNREIETGIPAKKVEAKFGKPVVILQEEGKEIWVYKPGGYSWFSGPKIRFHFRDGLLDDLDVNGISSTSSPQPDDDQE